jgi:hypothetical protein
MHSIFENLSKKSEEKNEHLNKLIKNISQSISSQWTSTHNSAIKLIEKGFTTQGKLITEHYDVIIIYINNVLKK